MRTLAAGMLAAILTGCGGSSTGPDAVPTTLTVTLPSAIGIGESIVGSAFATVGTSNVRQVGTGWRSGDPTIATVTNAGVVTGVRAGRTTVTVTYAGREAAASVRVVPDYQGLWSGSYRITQCTPVPSDVYRQTFCGIVDKTTGSIAFTFARTGEFVTGQFTLFDISFPAVTTRIAEDGSLQFTSTAIAAPRSSMKTDAQFTVNSARPGQFDGRVYWVLSGSAGLAGSGIAEGTVAATRP